MAFGHTYFDQYLRTATKGNVKVTYAVHVNRMQLLCKICDMTLTAPETDGTVIDYSVQEFVKIHAHTGGHEGTVHTHQWHGSQSDDKLHCACGMSMVSPTPVTCDFKAPFKPITPDALATLEKIKQMQKEDADKAKPYQTGQHDASKWANGWNKIGHGWGLPPSKEEMKQIIEQLAAKSKEIEEIKRQPSPPKKKDKPLKIATGRKFR